LKLPLCPVRNGAADVVSLAQDQTVNETTQ
jgi:hypothetical protein